MGEFKIFESMKLTSCCLVEREREREREREMKNKLGFFSPTKQ